MSKFDINSHKEKKLLYKKILFFKQNLKSLNKNNIKGIVVRDILKNISREVENPKTLLFKTENICAKEKAINDFSTFFPKQKTRQIEIIMVFISGLKTIKDRNKKIRVMYLRFIFFIAQKQSFIYSYSKYF